MFLGTFLSIIALSSVSISKVLAEDAVFDQRINPDSPEKASDKPAYSGDYFLNEKKSRFTPHRGRKRDFYSETGDEFGNDGQVLRAGNYPLEASRMALKKASFVPMRGRKDEYVPYQENDALPSPDDYLKRAAFVPLRGRKDSPNANYPYDEPSDNFRQMIEPVELASWLQGDSKAADFKRKTFYGMRGKRALRRGRSRFFASRG